MKYLPKGMAIYGKVVVAGLVVAIAAPLTTVRAEPQLLIINAAAPGDGAAAASDPSAIQVRVPIPETPPTAPHAGWPVGVSVAESSITPPNAHVAVVDKSKSTLPPPIVAIAPKAEHAFDAGFERVHKGTAQVVLTRYNRKSVLPVGQAPSPIVKAKLPAAFDPGFNMVECVAGCVGATRQVVYYAPRLSSRTSPPIIPAGATIVAAPAPSGSEAAIITCVAGCYATPKSYAAGRAPPLVRHANLDVQPAVATVVPTSASLEEPKPAVLKAKVRKQRVRQAARKPMKPLAWRTATHVRAVHLPPRAWRTVVRY